VVLEVVVRVIEVGHEPGIDVHVPDVTVEPHVPAVIGRGHEVVAGGELGQVVVGDDRTYFEDGVLLGIETSGL
jgi:hypothetical protein